MARSPMLPGSGCQLLFVTIATGLSLVVGFDALPLGGFSALGLRTSRFDFFWLLAITCSFTGIAPVAGVRAFAHFLKRRSPGAGAS